MFHDHFDYFQNHLLEVGLEREKNFGLLGETDVNEVFVRSSSNPMPTRQRYGGKDLLLPFESRHYSHQSLVTVTKSD